MISFEQYARVKDKYCFCYFGYSDEYLVLLKYIKQVLESHFLGLNVCLGCKDDKIHLLQDFGHLLTISQIKVERSNYGYIREVKFNGSTHPIEDILNECGNLQICMMQDAPRSTNKCVIVTEGAHPTKPLTDDQTQALIKIAKKENYEIDINGDAENASLVMGVESVQLFQAASKGIATKLVPTGLGVRLYKRLFSNGEVLSI